MKRAEVYLTEHHIPSARLEAELLLAHALQCRRIDLFLAYDRPLEEGELEKYRQLIRRKVSRIPTAYLTGKKEFYGLEFNTGPGALVPRPETELLVEKAADLIKQNRAGKDCLAADICTGSGVIAVTLAKFFKELSVYAVDISGEALELARQNAEKHGAAGRVRLLKGDLFEPLARLNIKFDLILANPPYIPSPEIPQLPPEIGHEPRLALDGGKDGLDIYRRILSEGKEFMADNGCMVLETGFGQAGKVGELAAQNGWDGRGVYADLAGIPRVMLFSLQGGS